MSLETLGRVADVENVHRAADEVTASEQALLKATLALTGRLDVAQTCAAMLDVAEQVFAARAAWILLHDVATDELVTVEYRGPGADTYRGARIPCDRGIVGLAFKRREAVFVPHVQQEDRWFDPERVHRSGLQSVFTLPLVIEDEAVGIVGLDSPLFTADAPPSEWDIARLRAITGIAAAGIRNARLLQSIEDERQRLRRLLDQRRHLRTEVGHLREQVREAHSFDAVIGQSAAFQDVLSQVGLVAPADSTVLLVGETGTGKELIARALHEQSRRAARPFVAVNCAALPETLVESELFGYEKGAFTGALARKAGKFEAADTGTLFLDEIGDLPAQAQAKLLRVLQEREVQRVGGTKSIPVNVRLIAATNQDLAACIQEGRFRPDLYYRLSVFPIRLPPLRERRADIALLVAHFLRRFADRQHKPVPRLAEGVMDRLVAYDWPGNIRELQNVVERAVILARGPEIGMDLIALTQIEGTAPSAPEPEQRPQAEQPASSVVRFSDAERRAIVMALESAGWRISGRAGAADILGLKPTTLHAKMKKLGIRRPSVAPRDPDPVGPSA